MTPAQRLFAIEDLLNQQLNPTSLTLEDNSAEHAGHASAGGAGHFTVHIASPQFDGKSIIQQHRLVYQALDALMETEIHALSIQVK
ncbi:MAG: BolA family transcriptional regulator [Gammaproteobacteria bacterium]|jgi:BolA protein|nr:BolA family transcriptional regulator [Gammaproteobacteria bacterium]MBT3490059.1 BolA family transcriptional regulator [Gammaproteobacteria bacterium]MBT3719481.1 BolA family transcriptional regulator [Gammaproteobacteria bacterium]MBT3843993.1 BolA family transcriptional regulator [Gammaproteobacteria bacterium]MBT3892940.1 BolA family transcriptional regulator [Gammaproteobacteria bacterium]